MTTFHFLKKDQEKHMKLRVTGILARARELQQVPLIYCLAKVAPTAHHQGSLCIRCEEPCLTNPNLPPPLENEPL